MGRRQAPDSRAQAIVVDVNVSCVPALTQSERQNAIVSAFMNEFMYGYLKSKP